MFSKQEYEAEITDIIDGDTLEAKLNLFPGIEYEVTLRLVAVDTHETYGVKKESEEYRLGKREAAFVEQWVADAEEIGVRILSKGKYGRYIAEVVSGDGEALSERLLAKFDGVKY